MKCHRCGAEEIDASKKRTTNIDMGNGQSAAIHYYACEDCMEQIGELLLTAFKSEVNDWAVKPRLFIVEVRS